MRDELGVARFEVDALDHEPDADRAPPARSGRAHEAKHEAAEHDAWFRAEVEKSLTRADSGEAQWFSHEEHHGEARRPHRPPERDRRVSVPVLWQDDADADLDIILDHIETESPAAP